VDISGNEKADKAATSALNKPILRIPIHSSFTLFIYFGKLLGVDEICGRLLKCRKCIVHYVLCVMQHFYCAALC